MDRKRLCVEVLGARNVASPESVDAYCIVGLCHVNPTKPCNGFDLSARSLTVTNSTNPHWNHVFDVVVPIEPGSMRMIVQVYSEKSFFFNMYPSNSRRCLSDVTKEAKDSDHISFIGKERRKVVAMKPRNHVNGWKVVQDTDSDEVVTLSEEEEDDAFVEESADDEDVVSSVIDEDANDVVGNGNGEMLGVVEINLSLLCKPLKAVTDAWYSLGGTRTGEVRIRSIWYKETTKPLTSQERDMLFEEHLTNAVRKPVTDFYGFNIPETAMKKWVHLRSYQERREERRVEDWTRLYGTQLPERLRRCSYKEKDTEEKTLLLQLTRAGIPRHLRERAYMHLSGAAEKQSNAGLNYYKDLLKNAEAIETEASRQIDLDIDRTFGHSKTAICSESGRQQLCRILRAYSLRNPSVGYCQGLNFIVAFLMLMANEEAVFWLLSVLCEDLYSGYYTPAMDDIQRDMLVLKQLIAEELWQLDESTSDVGLPLELLGSQWLLCLFTTTFPSETVYRIFDCIFTEGPTFVFPVIMTHLRQMEPTLLGLSEFHGVLSSIKDAESACIDGDKFMAAVCKEAESITASRVQKLREELSGFVRSEMDRAERARSFSQQLAIVYQVPAFSNYAVELLRFFHEEAEGSSGSNVAFVLTMLCHGLVWLAEQSKRWNR